jgi:uncharacterized protein (DUF983 family)
MALGDLFYSAVANKCPRCHIGRVFVNGNPYSFKNGLTMNKVCPHCHLKYEREVGYFYGAMYVSYAIQLICLSVIFALSLLWWHLEPFTLVITIIITTSSIFPITFRCSRIAWIAFFTPYEKHYAKM